MKSSGWKKKNILEKFILKSTKTFKNEMISKKKAYALYRFTQESCENDTSGLRACFITQWPHPGLLQRGSLH